jgi:Tfp pilus assembly protein PilF
MVHFFNGIANLQLKKYNECVKSLKKAVVMTGDNVPLEAQTYASLGEVYHLLKRYGASDSSYEKALLLKPDDAFVMNNYAYYLSLRQVNLERAEALSKRTLELTPNNASFEDTYGWILFRLNKLEEAKKWIEKALSQENNGNNPTLLEHLGDVYANMGQEAKALECWNKAVINKSDSPSIAKKIAARKVLEE